MHSDQILSVASLIIFIILFPCSSSSTCSIYTPCLDSRGAFKLGDLLNLFYSPFPLAFSYSKTDSTNTLGMAFKGLAC